MSPTRPTPLPHYDTGRVIVSRGSAFSNAQNSQLSTTNHELRTTNTSGFTLTEILIVIGIIVLFIALAVPAFNTLRGARSVEGARSLVASMLDRARQDALRTGEYRGVFFAPSATDPNRTVLALVSRVPSDFSADGDPLDRYKAYDPAVRYTAGQRVTFPVRDAHPNAGNRIYNITFRRTANSPNTVGTAPTQGNNGGTNFMGRADLTIPSQLVNAIWEPVTPGELDLVPADQGGAVQALPPGVGAQTINSAPVTITSQPNPCDRYFTAGVIFFSPLGRPDSIPYTVSKSSALGKDILALENDIKVSTQFTPPARDPGSLLLSQSAVVLYDAVTFQEQAGPGAKTPDLLHTYSTAALTQPPDPTQSPVPADETTEETWLTENALLLNINKQTGAIQDVE